MDHYVGTEAESRNLGEVIKLEEAREGEGIRYYIADISRLHKGWSGALSRGWVAEQKKVKQQINFALVEKLYFCLQTVLYGKLNKRSLDMMQS